jgi:hypothetical protein
LVTRRVPGARPRAGVDLVGSYSAIGYSYHLFELEVERRAAARHSLWPNGQNAWIEQTVAHEVNKLGEFLQNLRRGGNPQKERQRISLGRTDSLPAPLWSYLMALLYCTRVSTCTTIAEADDTVGATPNARLLGEAA